MQGVSHVLSLSAQERAKMSVHPVYIKMGMTIPGRNAGEPPFKTSCLGSDRQRRLDLRCYTYNESYIDPELILHLSSF